MKKPLGLFLLLLTAILALFAIVQFRTIMVLRAELQTVRGIAAEKEKLAAQVPKLKADNDILKAESEALRQRRAETAAEKPASNEPATAATAKPAEKATTADPMAGFRKMFSDPAMKKMVLQQQDSMMRLMYGDLSKQLHLDATKSAELMELIQQRQGEVFEAALKVGDSGATALAGGEGGNSVDALRTKYDDQIKELLGDQYPAFQAYEQTLGDRALMQQYQQQFAATEYPLSDQQRAGLLQIMADERAQMPKTAFDAGNRNFTNQLAALNSDEALHEYAASQTELNRRVLERAGSLLTPEQLSALANMQKQMLDMQVSGMQMSRAIFKKN